MGINGSFNRTSLGSNNTSLPPNFNTPSSSDFFSGHYFPPGDDEDGRGYPFTSFWDLWPRKTVSKQQIMEAYNGLAKVLQTILKKVVFPAYNYLYNQKENSIDASRFSKGSSTGLTHSEIVQEALRHSSANLTYLVYHLEIDGCFYDDHYKMKNPIHYKVVDYYNNRSANVIPYDDELIGKLFPIGAPSPEAILTELRKVDAHGDTVLTLAIRFGGLKLLRHLLETLNAPVHVESDKANLVNPFVEVIRRQERETAKVLQGLGQNPLQIKSLCSDPDELSTFISQYPESSLQLQSIQTQAQASILMLLSRGGSPFVKCGLESGIEYAISHSYEPFVASQLQVPPEVDAETLKRAIELARIKYHYARKEALEDSTKSSRMERCFSILSKLLEIQSQLEQSPDYFLMYGGTPLSCAVESNDERLVMLLLNHRADPNYKGGCEHVSRVPLIEAIELKNHNIVNLLLEANADVNAEDAMGYTPLMRAAAGGDLKLVEKLLERGAKTDREHSALRSAILGKHSHVVDYLLRAGFDNEEDTTSGYLNPLDDALSMSNNLEMMSTLLDHQAKSNLYSQTQLSYLLLKHLTRDVESDVCAAKKIVQHLFVLFTQNPESFFQKVDVVDLPHRFDHNPVRGIDLFNNVSIIKLMESNFAALVLDQIVNRYEKARDFSPEKRNYRLLRDSVLKILAETAHHTKLLTDFPVTWTDPKYHDSYGLGLFELAFTNYESACYVLKDLKSKYPVEWENRTQKDSKNVTILHRMCSIPYDPRYPDTEMGLGLLTPEHIELFNDFKKDMYEKANINRLRHVAPIETDEDPKDPMDLALEEENWGMVDFLLKLGYSIEDNKERFIEQGLLNRVLRARMDENLRSSLLNHNWPEELLNTRGVDGDFPLDIALKNEALELACHFIALGARQYQRPNEHDHFLVSFMEIRDKDLEPEEIELFVESFREIARNMPKTIITPLEAAIDCGYPNFVLTCLHAGLFNHASTKGGNVLHYLTGEAFLLMERSEDIEFNVFPILHSMKFKAPHLLFEKRLYDNLSPFDLLVQSKLISNQQLGSLLKDYPGLDTCEDEFGQEIVEKLFLRGFSVEDLYELRLRKEWFEDPNFLASVYIEKGPLVKATLESLKSMGCHFSSLKIKGRTTLQTLAQRMQNNPVLQMPIASGESFEEKYMQEDLSLTQILGLISQYTDFLEIALLNFLGYPTGIPQEYLENLLASWKNENGTDLPLDKLPIYQFMVAASDAIAKTPREELNQDLLKQRERLLEAFALYDAFLLIGQEREGFKMVERNVFTSTEEKKVMNQSSSLERNLDLVLEGVKQIEEVLKGEINILEHGLLLRGFQAAIDQIFNVYFPKDGQAKRAEVLIHNALETNNAGILELLSIEDEEVKNLNIEIAAQTSEIAPKLQYLLELRNRIESRLKIG